MCLFRYDDDPDPEERTPARPLYVPVRVTGADSVLRVFRTPLGARTAVGFTSRARLAQTLGAGQPCIRLAEAALRALTGPMGVTRLTVDPTLSAPATVAVATEARVRAERLPAPVPRLAASEEMSA
ncbi:SAV_915 family protein [Streptomyces sp. NPDC005840]|uniref:SAV_915 family protein n=1 Tax=Streptomyces sp. NPDC005840 TaxID=3157072 RepID=UPI0033F04867